VEEPQREAGTVGVIPLTFRSFLRGWFRVAFDLTETTQYILRLANEKQGFSRGPDARGQTIS